MLQKVSFCLLIFGLIVFSVAVSEDIIRATTLDLVPMGTHYTQTLPEVTDGSMFNGMKAAITIANYVEDIEVLFPYTYLAMRGADIDIICPAGQTEALAGDYTKPTWIIPCIAADTLSENDWTSYDIMIVPGGAGIYYLRNDSYIIDGMNAFMTTLGNGSPKVFAPICAGSEICVSVNCSFLNDSSDITTAGSPTSAQVLIDGGMDYILSDLVVMHDYSENGTVKRENAYVIGHDPTAHSVWTQSIGYALTGITEDLSDSDPYAYINDYSNVFVDCPNDLSEMYGEFTFGDTDYYKTLDIADLDGSVEGMSVGIIASRGASWNEYAYFYDAFTKNGANVSVYCPWVLDGDYVDRQEFKNGMIPIAYVFCDALFTDKPTPEILVIPSGVWANTTFRRMSVGIIASRGASWNEYAYFYDAFTKNGANVSVYCPWVLDGDYVDRQEFKNGMIPIAYVFCDALFTDKPTPEILVIPSGVWANTTFRSDPNVFGMIANANHVIAIGEAVEHLAAAGVLTVCPVSTTDFAVNYITNKSITSYSTVKPVTVCEVNNKKYITAVGPESSLSSIVNAFSSMKNDHPKKDSSSNAPMIIAWIITSVSIVGFIVLLILTLLSLKKSKGGYVPV
ncbi:hypothetical protein ADUPG1_011812 [Aduncisulcus paluster]|uniref:DJ-1/PfpI domain-containing protein n=1 Tax=Aduncisulcus paluster TaxID=2918883 RepID=A0ABQ5JZJ9_9EUKA|nr:hypothetical protein ADUPG1_011812 [Aduncisulcus paluster]